MVRDKSFFLAGLRHQFSSQLRSSSAVVQTREPEANLEIANFEIAYFKNANSETANFETANFETANFESANF